MLRFSMIAVLLFIAAPAFAQQQVDPRLAGPMIQALQSQQKLTEALLKMTQEDAQAMKAKLCEAIPEDKRVELQECAKPIAQSPSPPERTTN